MAQTVLATQSAALRGAGLQQQRPSGFQRGFARAAAPQAFFGRKSAAVVEPPPPAPAKRGFFGRKPAVVVEEPPAPVKRGLFGRSSSPAAPKQQPAKKQPAKKQQRSKTVDKAAEYEQRQSFFSKAVSALDFAEVRSKSDAELLYEAKYGKRDASGKMSREQYAALRRRVGGTAKDYWKDWVDVKGDYVDKGFVSKDRSATANSVPALPFLVATVLLMLGATAFVVSQTS